MTPFNGKSGQTTLELLISGSLVVLMLTGAGWVFRAQWNRAKCAFLVFEHTHARLVGSVSLQRPASYRISILDGPTDVIGEAQCKDAHEKVVFKKLENSQWR